MIAKKSKSTKRQILAVTASGVFLLASLVVSGSLFFGGKSQTVHAQDTTGANRFPCTNRTLKGRYGMKGDGLVPSGPPRLHSCHSRWLGLRHWMVRAMSLTRQQPVSMAW